MRVKEIDDKVFLLSDDGYEDSALHKTIGNSFMRKFTLDHAVEAEIVEENNEAV